MISPEFLLTAFVVVVVPGTGVLYTVSTALSRGRSAAIVAAVGCTLGIVPHLVAAGLGITTILHLSAQIFRFVRYVGVAYLLYLSYSMWKHAQVFEIGRGDEEISGLRIVGRAVLLNLLNPKLTLFFLAFIPQFLPPTVEAPVVAMAALSGVFMIMTLVVFVGYGMVASGARAVLAESPRAIRLIQRSFAAVLAVFAIRLAIADE